MAAKTHVDTAGTGHIEFFRPLQHLFTNDEPAKRTKNSPQDEDFQQESEGKSTGFQIDGL
jgi:hypothetical protein